LPNSVQRKIRKGKPSYLRHAPKDFLKIAAKNRKRYAVRLSTDRMYVMKRESISGHFAGWGEPIIYPVLKNLYHMQIALKAQESILFDHILPLRIISPTAGTNDVGAATSVEFAAGKIKRIIRQWHKDPNTIATIPYPLQLQQFGGNGRALLLTQELEYMQRTILSGMQLPADFFSGSTNWSNMSINLRMLENFFLEYIDTTERFLDFLVQQTRAILGWPPCKVGIKSFRMADDAQLKQMMLNMAGMDPMYPAVDMQTVRESFGIDEEEYQTRLKRQTTQRNRLQEEYLISQQVATAKAGLAAQEIQQNAAVTMEELNQTGPDGEMEGAGQPTQPTQPAQPGQPEAKKKEPEQPSDDDKYKMAAKKLSSMPEEQRNMYIQKIQKTNPKVAAKIITFMNKPQTPNNKTTPKEKRLPGRSGNVSG